MRALSPFGLVSLAFLLPACASETPATTKAPDNTTTGASATPVDAGAAALPEPPLPPGAPDTAVGHQLAWVLDAITNIPSETAASAHFSKVFLDKVPAAAIPKIFSELSQEVAPLIVESVTPGQTPDSIGARLKSTKSEERIRISLHVEAGPAPKIDGLFFTPDLAAPTSTSWDDVQKNLKAVGGNSAFLAASLEGTKCTPLSEVQPTAALALGSAFKLYVLDALARQIEAKKHAWTDTIAIDEKLKSLPSGEMRNEPAGKTFTVREYAEKMIAVSDNTATDHLIAFVGRTEVEAAVKATHHATPAKMVPFLSTRDLFAIKLLTTEDEQTKYIAATVAEKRKMLVDFESRDLGPAMEKAGAWKTPRHIDTLEWFASPLDICHLMIDLKAYADKPATSAVGEILALNPGVPDDAKAYKYIGFKGGSEPGVLTVNWLLERAADQKWVFLGVLFNDTKAIDEAKALGAAASARNFLGSPAGATPGTTQTK